MLTTTIKKYGNRRLYDSDASRYVTLEEIAATIRSGRDVRVLDAKTSEDLTQATLAPLVKLNHDLVVEAVKAWRLPRLPTATP